MCSLKNLLWWSVVIIGDYILTLKLFYLFKYELIFLMYYAIYPYPAIIVSPVNFNKYCIYSYKNKIKTVSYNNSA